jgi:hypothetical protein
MNAGYVLMLACFLVAVVLALGYYLAERNSRIPTRGRIVAHVAPSFGWLELIGPIYPGQARGFVRVREGKIIVELDNYYSVEALRETFGKIEFVALEFLPPATGNDFDEMSVKKFEIANWVLERAA